MEAAQPILPILLCKFREPETLFLFLGVSVAGSQASLRTFPYPGHSPPTKAWHELDLLQEREGIGQKTVSSWKRERLLTLCASAFNSWRGSRSLSFLWSWSWFHLTSMIRLFQAWSEARAKTPNRFSRDDFPHPFFRPLFSFFFLCLNCKASCCGIYRVDRCL